MKANDKQKQRKLEQCLQLIYSFYSLALTKEGATIMKIVNRYKLSEIVNNARKDEKCEVGS